MARVDGAAQGGSIVLIHLGGWNTLGALPRIVADLTRRPARPGHASRPPRALTAALSGRAWTDPRIVVTVAVAARQKEPDIAARKNALYADGDPPPRR